MKREKEDWIEQQCMHIEESLRRCKTKSTYETVQQLTTSKIGLVNVIKDKYDKCLTEQKIIKCWKECCSELYNDNVEGNLALFNCCQSTNEDECPVL